MEKIFPTSMGEGERMKRDFVGYGPHPPQVEWPHGARIAVSVVVNYEEGAEYSLLDGDPHGEVMGEVPSPVSPTQRDLANESFFVKLAEK
jgi:hypothetical protein